MLHGSVLFFNGVFLSLVLKGLAGLKAVFEGCYGALSGSYAALLFMCSAFPVPSSSNNGATAL